MCARKATTQSFTFFQFIYHSTKVVAWLVGVAVSTTDSDSVDGGSIPSRAFLMALEFVANNTNTTGDTFCQIWYRDNVLLTVNYHQSSVKAVGLQVGCIYRRFG